MFPRCCGSCGLIFDGNWVVMFTVWINVGATSSSSRGFFSGAGQELEHVQGLGLNAFDVLVVRLDECMGISLAWYLGFVG